MKILIWVILIVVQIPTYTYSQVNRDFPSNGKAGKCFAKAFIQSEYVKDEMTLLVYTGDKIEDITIDTLYFRLRKETNQLVYIGWIEDLKKFDFNENSDGIEKIIFVQDTSETQEVVKETFEYLELIRENDEIGWIRVVCEGNLQEYLIEIQEALEKREYLSKPFESYYGGMTKKALKKFQIDNFLPLGQIDFKTLEKLGIEI